ncbi:hypothetical protein [Streptomyces sp. NPDC001307]|uniref:hypothetical protein n=1 Tax=Streptomyces sp. NPDC001307 TaxID=3364560 RepID=UPI0036C00DC1
MSTSWRSASSASPPPGGWSSFSGWRSGTRQARTHGKAIIRLLKRAIAREIFRYLTTPVTVPDVSDLRPARQAKNLALTTVAEHFGVWPAVISCIERGTRRDDNLADAYQDWLRAA